MKRGGAVFSEGGSEGRHEMEGEIKRVITGHSRGEVRERGWEGITAVAFKDHHPLILFSRCLTSTFSDSWATKPFFTVGTAISCTFFQYSKPDLNKPDLHCYLRTSNSCQQKTSLSLNPTGLHYS